MRRLIVVAEWARAAHGEDGGDDGERGTTHRKAIFRPKDRS
jgi:hypothetical protein